MTKKSYRIVIAEDHTILREGLRSLLSSNPDLEIVGEAEDGRSAIRCIDEFRPDLVLMDLSMPKMNGLDAIAEVKNQYPDTKVLVLTVHKAEEYVFESLKAGADGYLLKDATHAELVMAIKKVVERVTMKYWKSYRQMQKQILLILHISLIYQRKRCVKVSRIMRKKV